MKTRLLYLFIFCIFICSILTACFTDSEVDHKHVFEQNVSEEYLKTPATCDNNYIYYKSCSCGEVSNETFEYGQPLGHSYSNWESNKDSTHTKKCSNDVSHIVTEKCSDSDNDHKCDVCNYKLTNCIDNDNNNYCDICNIKLNNNSNNQNDKDIFCDITFLDENGKILKVISMKEGTIPSYSYIPTDTKEWDYTFVGWSTTLNGIVLNTLPNVTKDASYYAVVSKAKKCYSVSFNTNGADIISPQIINYGSTAVKPSNPKKDGYTFVCWTTDVEGNNVFDWTTLITSDITLYAKWSKAENNVYQINFFNENGILLTVKSLSEGTKPSCSYTPVDTVEWDYTFVGWSTTLNGIVLNTLPNVTKDASYYAVVSKAKKCYSVSFNTNGADIISPQIINYGSTAVKPSNPKKDGYAFVCWTTDVEGNNVFDWTTLITSDITLYAKWNIKVNIIGILETLLNSYDCSPYSYIPEALQPSSSKNHISSDQIITDYSKFINVSKITSHGYGEQLNMIIENINQSNIFFTALSVVESLSTVSVVSFNNYLDNNPSNTAHYTFKSGIYNVTINYDGEVLVYVLDYTTNLLGEHTAQIVLSMNTLNGEKVVRVQIGDSNALKYVMNENSYQFAIRYLGVRRAYFSAKRNNDDTVEGNIYEFLTVDGFEFKSSADFYIDDVYTTVVGNKASGMHGWTGTIAEVYNNSNGKLVGYEVEETLSKITYNSLWFDLDVIKGLDSIKYVEKTNTSEEHFYLNGSNKAWESKKVGGLGTKMLSRRFDIEFRTQYFYTYNTETSEYEKITAKIPMLFVQEEVYDDLVTDIKQTNNIDITIDIGNEELDKILIGYDNYIPVFQTRKDNLTSQMIVDFIGEKIKFAY